MDSYVFESPQDLDTYVQVYKQKPFIIRYAAVRSAESREHEQPGQDFLTFKHDVGGLTFVVCDGVSQSFHGDYASRYLGRRLLDWMPKVMQPDAEIEFVRGQFVEYLSNITRFAAEEVERIPIPEETPELLRQVLEEKRSIGSESTFICGRLELPRPKFPVGSALFVFMGDSRLRIGRGKELGETIAFLEQSEQGDRMSRWSTRKGPVGGTPAVVALPLVHKKQLKLDSVLTYTDGLKELDDLNVLPSNKQLDEIIAAESNAIYNDDCSLIEVELF